MRRNAYMNLTNHFFPILFHDPFQAGLADCLLPN